MPILDQIPYVNDATFRALVKSAMVVTAHAVAGEALVVGKEQKYNKRHDLAMQILTNPDSVLEGFVWDCASNLLTNSSTDGQFQSTISGTFSNRAGVLAAEN